MIRQRLLPILTVLFITSVPHLSWAQSSRMTGAQEKLYQESLHILNDSTASKDPERVARAIDLLDEALDEGPKLDILYLMRARAFTFIGACKEAQDAFQTAVRSPTIHRKQMSRSVRLSVQERVAEQVDLCKPAVSADDVIEAGEALLASEVASPQELAALRQDFAQVVDAGKSTDRSYLVMSRVETLAENCSHAGSYLDTSLFAQKTLSADDLETEHAAAQLDFLFSCPHRNDQEQLIRMIVKNLMLLQLYEAASTQGDVQDMREFAQDLVDEDLEYDLTFYIMSKIEAAAGECDTAFELIARADNAPSIINLFSAQDLEAVKSGPLGQVLTSEVGPLFTNEFTSQFRDTTIGQLRANCSATIKPKCPISDVLLMFGENPHKCDKEEIHLTEGSYDVIRLDTKTGEQFKCTSITVENGREYPLDLTDEMKPNGICGPRVQPALDPPPSTCGGRCSTTTRKPGESLPFALFVFGLSMLHNYRPRRSNRKQ